MIQKFNFWVLVLLWGTVGIQIIPVYLSCKIYSAYPRVQDWSIAWLFFIASMITVGIRRISVALSFRQDCTIEGLWLFDHVLMTYVNSILFWIFAEMKQRFFLKWFSFDRLKGDAAEKKKID